MRRYGFLFIITVLLLMAGVMAAAPTQQTEITPFQRLVFDARGDLENLADTVIGQGERPPNWTFNFEIESPTYTIDLWFDNEQLADVIFGIDQRPPEWFGGDATTLEILGRNIRHDLEINADTVFGVDVRPDEWRGASPVFRCSRALQNLLTLSSSIYNITPQTPNSALNFCSATTAEVDEQLVNTIFSDPTLDSQLNDLILAVRGDLERLANETLGLNNRPEGWTGNTNPNSLTLAGDNFLDIESLANNQLGMGVRPDEWIGVLSNQPALIFRNQRHDLELLADATLGDAVRPHGWQGEDPTLRCNVAVSDLRLVLEQNFEEFAFTVDPTTPNFCQAASVSLSQFAERPQIDEDLVVADEDSRFMAESQIAFAYLDVAATQYMGMMPQGTRFRAWYRNFGDSNMMFVSGENFALYIDRRWTTLTETTFNTLPTLQGVRPLTFCDAAWCDGPGPTPTPTGFGAVEQLAFLATQPAPPQAEEIENKTTVNWNHIRVTYLQDNTVTGTAQVTLEICQEVTQITCEPVTSIFDNLNGAPKPVISTFNGQNVYEFSYGYTSNLTVEGPTLVSPDVWISDPTIR
ncbi:MAG: hypothetical protein D6737_10415 [Chloroflexi bacterium]|nr:MAG: hypothetical protein CUN54_05260 [Phototrophicales bacterium]RMF79766.1 MAG: hypothetical protein D6737_10415 [Chloroflexota bacterium]